MKAKILLLTLVLFAIVLSSCTTTSHKNAIKVGYLPMVSSLTHFVAVESGYYKDEGLDVQAQQIMTSNLIAQELVAGNIDVAIELSIIPLLKQLEKSPNAAKLFSISSITSENGFDGVLVQSNSQIVKLEDIAGKKIGVFPGTTAKNSLYDIYKKQYPDLALPICIELDPIVHLQSLANGDIDALFAYEPTLTLGIVENGFREISSSIYAIQYSPNPIGVGAVNDKWLVENRETAKAFFKAIDRAVEFIENNPIEARRILAKATDLDENIANEMNIMPLSLSTNIDYTNLRGYLEVLKKLGEINETPSPKDICIYE